MRSMNGRHVPWLVITSFITGLPAVSPLVTMWSLQEESIPWQQYQDTMMTALWVTCPDWTRGGQVMAVHHFCLRASRWDWQQDVTHEYWCLYPQVLIVTGGYDGDNYLDSTELLRPSSDWQEIISARLPRPMCCVRVNNVDNRVLLSGEWDK